MPGPGLICRTRKSVAGALCPPGAGISGARRAFSVSDMREKRGVHSLLEKNSMFEETFFVED